ncbi:MAG: dimethylamine monooxygenase subunit DmmA family protein [Pleurocapsa sp.]
MNSISLLTKFEFDLSGSRHIVCAEGDAVDLICNQIEKLGYVPENTNILCLSESIVVDKKLNIKYVSTLENLIAKLIENLSSAYMGTRFYAVGSEQFVGDLRNHPIRLGMGSDEITLAVVERKKKRVFCSTCHEINTQVTTKIFNCFYCGIKLEIWSHFSCLKNAYLGVCADAEEVL